MAKKLTKYLRKNQTNHGEVTNNMIFITGPHGSGKTHIANFLSQNGFQPIDLGPRLRTLWRATSGHIPFENFIRTNEKKYGRHFTDAILSAEILKVLDEIYQNGNIFDISITGNRSIDGIHYIQTHCPDGGKRRAILYVEADEFLLYERFCKRDGQITVDEFQTILKRDKELGLEAIKPEADFVITNNGTTSELETKVLTIVHNDLGYPTINTHEERII